MVHTCYTTQVVRGEPQSRPRFERADDSIGRSREPKCTSVWCSARLEISSEVCETLETSQPYTTDDWKECIVITIAVDR